MLFNILLTEEMNSHRDQEYFRLSGFIEPDWNSNTDLQFFNPNRYQFSHAHICYN